MAKKIKLERDFYDSLLADNVALTEEVDRLKVENEYEKEVVVVAIPTHASKAFDFQKDLKMNIVKLNEPTHFADCEALGELNHPEIEFETMCLFCKREFEDEFHFSDMPLFFPDVDLIGQASSGWLILVKWLPDNVPCCFVAYTERDAEEFMDFVTSANAEIINNLYVEVLERMYLDMRNSFSKFAARLEAALFMAEKDRYDKEQFMNEIRNRVLGMDNATANKLNQVAPSRKFTDKLINMPAWGVLALGLGWVAAFVMAFFI